MTALGNSLKSNGFAKFDARVGIEVVVASFIASHFHRAKRDFQFVNIS